jgi:anti-sigma factor RsiW
VTLLRQIEVGKVPKEVFAGFFPGAAELAEMFAYFQAHRYLGSDSRDEIALANKVAAVLQPSLWTGSQATSAASLPRRLVGTYCN